MTAINFYDIFNKKKMCVCVLKDLLNYTKMSFMFFKTNTYIKIFIFSNIEKKRSASSSLNIIWSRKQTKSVHLMYLLQCIPYYAYHITNTSST